MPSNWVPCITLLARCSYCTAVTCSLPHEQASSIDFGSKPAWQVGSSIQRLVYLQRPSSSAAATLAVVCCWSGTAAGAMFASRSSLRPAVLLWCAAGMATSCMTVLAARDTLHAVGVAAVLLHVWQLPCTDMAVMTTCTHVMSILTLSMLPGKRLVTRCSALPARISPATSFHCACPEYRHLYHILLHMRGLPTHAQHCCPDS